MTTPNNSDQAALHDDLRMKLSGALARAFNAGSFGAHYDSNSHADELIAALTLPASEAVNDVLWRIDNEAEQFIDEKGMIYLRYLRDLLTTPQPAPSAHAGGEVVAVDALREKLQELREEVSVQQSLMDHYQDWDDANRLFDKLTALLSGGAAREEAK